MTPTTQAGLFALQFITDVAVFFLVIRVALRLSMSHNHSPFVYAIAKITNPLCRPLARFIPQHKRWDSAALLWALVIQAVYYTLAATMMDKSYAALGLLLLSFSDVVAAFFNLWFLTIIAEAILSFIRPVQMDHNLSFIADINRPVLTPIRQWLPQMGGIDLSPLVALFIIKLSEIFIIGWLQQLAAQWL